MWVIKADLVSDYPYIHDTKETCITVLSTPGSLQETKNGRDGIRKVALERAARPSPETMKMFIKRTSVEQFLQHHPKDNSKKQ